MHVKPLLGMMAGAALLALLLAPAASADQSLGYGPLRYQDAEYRSGDCETNGHDIHRTDTRLTPEENPHSLRVWTESYCSAYYHTYWARHYSGQEQGFRAGADHCTWGRDCGSLWMESVGGSWDHYYGSGEYCHTRAFVFGTYLSPGCLTPDGAAPPMLPRLPALPEGPEAPALPALVEAPEAPVLPAAPDAPEAPATPDAPDAPEAPALP